MSDKDSKEKEKKDDPRRVLWLKVASFTPGMVYLLHGRDLFARDHIIAMAKRTVQADAQDFNLEVLDASACKTSEIRSAVTSMPMYAGNRVVIIKQVDLFDQNKILDLRRIIELRCAYSITLLTQMNRTALLEDPPDWMQIIEVQHLYGDNLIEAIKTVSKGEKLELGRGDAKLIAQEIGGDIQEVKNFIIKAKMLGETMEECVKKILHEETSNTFDITDSLIAGNRSAAISHLEEMLSAGTPEQVILVQVFRFIRNVQSYADGNKDLPVAGNQLDRIASAAKRWNAQVLAKATITIYHADVCAKTGEAGVNLRDVLIALT